MHSPISAGGVEPTTKFSKRKLKSEIFNDKRSLSTKMILSVIAKNWNWEILTRI